jgi:uncharacterized Zn finger protein
VSEKVSYRELLKPCPECASEELEPVEVVSSVPGWYVSCLSCGYDGPQRLSLKHAMKRWNEGA